MSKKIKDFLEGFQDMYLDTEVKLAEFSPDLSKLDLRIIDKALADLLVDVNKMNTLTTDASNEVLNHYTDILQIIDDKLTYIANTADVYTYMNSYFDMRTIKDSINYNLNKIVMEDCMVDRIKRGVTLNSTNSLYRCPKTIEDDMITFYNTNNSSHSGIQITSPFLDTITIKKVSIRKADGTLLDVDIDYKDTDNLYIKHELLTSAQIVLTVETHRDYLESLNVNLLEYDYLIEGSFILEEASLKSSDLLTFIHDATIPDDTYANMNISLSLRDVNKQELSNITMSIPIGKNLVCKRLDRINYNEVDKIVSLYTNYKKTTRGLSKAYLQSLEFKNERYVIYIPKDLEENIVNKHVQRLGATSFKIDELVVKDVVIHINIELFSFQPRVSPTIKHITGVTKNEKL